MKVTRVDEEEDLPSAVQVIALLNSRDQLAKLEWEIEQLRGYLAEPPWQPIAYAASNCAVTAWHLADWVWSDLSAELQANYVSGKRFRLQLRTQCRALDVCETLANAAKHRVRIPSQINDGIAVRMTAAVQRFQCGDPAGSSLGIWEWRPTIVGAGGTLPLIDVFREAAAFWASFMDQAGITQPDRTG